MHIASKENIEMDAAKALLQKSAPPVSEVEGGTGEMCLCCMMSLIRLQFC